MYKSRSICIGLAAVLLVLAPPRTVQADDGPGVVPLGQSVDHRSYAEWTAAWWQWALSYAPDVNPVIDPDGTYSGQGQSGPVWFLAGAFGGTAVRNVTIPQGKYLLLALANSEWDTVPGFQNGLGLPDPLSVEDIRAITSYNLRGMSVTCSIDGDSVEHLDRFRVKSPVFSFNFDPALATAFGYPAPYVRTAVSDGYWLMLQPLDP